MDASTNPGQARRRGEIRATRRVAVAWQSPVLFLWRESMPTNQGLPAAARHTGVPRDGRAEMTSLPATREPIAHRARPGVKTFREPQEKRVRPQGAQAAPNLGSRLRNRGRRAMQP